MKVATAANFIFHLHSAVSAGAPQAIQVADRFHVAKNLSEAVQQLLARVLLEMKTGCNLFVTKDNVGHFDRANGR